MKPKLIRLTTAAMCLALCMVLPFLTGGIPKIGTMLCPMHLPVLLCGFLCGPFYGLAVGLAAPLLRAVLFGAPPLFPIAFAMAFELAAYGLFSGLFYRLLPNRPSFLYGALLLSMTLGRVVWGLVQYLLLLLGKVSFGWELFLAKAFTDALPGIVLQIVLVPLLVFALKRTRLYAK